jgi:effector-binding domain-containing protein
MTTYAIELVRLEAAPLAVVRRRARPPELSRLVPEGCGLVWRAVRAQQAKAGRHVAVYWDDTIRLDIGVELLGAFDEVGEVVRSATPGGLVARTVHFGPYTDLGAAHDAVHDWALRQGRTLAGPRWEIYGHWDPAWNTDSSKIRTDVHYLLSDDV